ncbi:hypothetical protein EU527_18550, partial [Candidatus Thorarchaeota archaeon]
MTSNRRFIIPLLFSSFGIITTILVTLSLSGSIAEARPNFDFVPIVAGTVQSDVRMLLYILFPIQYLTFFLLTIPLALLMIIFAKLSRSVTYELGIFSTGQDFNAAKMVRRSIVPALFALSTGELFLNLLPDWIFSITPETGSAFLRLFNPLQVILGALIALIAAIVFFAPTWILNDAGIITQIKASQMKIRRCPDTEGIGRWYSSLFGGFAILAYPITMIHRFFYRPLFIYDVPLDGIFLLHSIFWIFGIPLLIMAFVMPFIILNELTINRTSSMIQNFA